MLPNALSRLFDSRNFLPCAALSLAMFLGVGCHAQTASKPAAVSQAELDRRIEIKVREKFQVPADISVSFGKRSPSAVSGYETLPIIFSRDGNAQQPVDFLVSADGKTLARMQTFDISKDPASIVSAAGRPSRGDAKAPVQIVVFDDLECPYCARMHAELFPDTLDHYKGKVSIAYKDYPLVEIHPWAMHAAIDSNCLFSQGGPHANSAYWSFVDYVHAHAAEMGGDQHDLPTAIKQLDGLAQKQGAADKLNSLDLTACMAKQDEAGIRASMKQGDAVNVNATPILFVDGERIDGALPTPDVWKVIDRALLARGITPPPLPRPIPVPSAQPVAPAQPGPSPASSPASGPPPAAK